MNNYYFTFYDKKTESMEVKSFEAHSFESAVSEAYNFKHTINQKLGKEFCIVRYFDSQYVIDTTAKKMKMK